MDDLINKRHPILQRQQRLMAIQAKLLQDQVNEILAKLTGTSLPCLASPLSNAQPILTFDAPEVRFTPDKLEQSEKLYTSSHPERTGEIGAQATPSQDEQPARHGRCAQRFS